MSGPWNSAHFRLGIGLLTVLAMPPVRSGFEAGLVSHMLLQLPLLGYGGWHVGVALRSTGKSTLEDWDRYGVTGFILTVCIALFWMLPRSIETSLNEPGYELAKFMSVPLAGFALASSYPRAPPLLRGLLLSHVISMFGVLAWTFLAAPVRLCLAYLAAEQLIAGYIFLATGLALAAYWSTRLLLCGVQSQSSSMVSSRTQQDNFSEAIHEHR